MRGRGRVRTCGRWGLICATAWLTGVSASAQTAEPIDAGDGFDPLRGRREAVAPMDGASLLDLFSQVERWVRRAETAAQAEPWGVRDALGVRVTLLIDGRVFGSGERWRPDPERFVDQPPEPTDLVDLARLATVEALASAQDTAIRMAQARRDAGGPPVEPRSLEELGGLFSLSLEVAHSVRRLDPAPGDAAHTAYRTAYPGRDGLVCVNPDTNERATIWPTAAMLGGEDLEQSSARLRLQTDVGEGGRWFAFETWHAARGGVDRPAAVLERGRPAGAGDFLGAAELTRLIRQQGRHLVGRIDSEGVILGQYQPQTNQSERLPTSERASAAFTLWALSRYAGQALQWANPSDAFQTAALDDLRFRLDVGLARWSALLPGQNERESAGIDAVFLLASLDHPFGGDPILRDDLAARVQRANASGFSPGEAALVAAALGTWADRTGNAEAAQQAGRIAGDLARKLETSGVHARDLPWLAELARRWPVDPDSPDGAALEAEAANTLRKRLVALTRNLVLGQQIDRAPDDAPRDVVGAFLFDRDELPFGQAIDPTWKSALTLRFVAVGLGEPGLLGAGPDAFGPTLAASSCAAFLGRLTLDPDGAYLAADPAFALGGVRETLWSNRMPIEATAVSLLALMEFYDATSRMEAAQVRQSLPEVDRPGAVDASDAGATAEAPTE
ncbi:MAG: hypothetical protein AAF288_06930 [Planctomycetota bacterium]